MSWAAASPIAALYALRRQQEHGGRSVVLTMTVPRELVMLCTGTTEAETVLIDASGGAVDTDDAVEIERLASIALPRGLATAADEWLRVGLDSNDGWHGWTGDYDQ